ncbi:gag-pol polyprotein [Cucumis melo var. makuwa]|uniref:Gag-pol polyprotein n=1 Tax=Cucumis melo var. makuwa TaxID=1194695 RepID=A0A5D3DHP3_CUCMM|nr:gag-pol polyprotein [Cucumis melo var. makuwa]
MLNSGTENLDSILKSGHNGSHRYGLGFVASTNSLKATSEIKFVEMIHTETGIRLQLHLLGERVTIVVEKSLGIVTYGSHGSNANRKSGGKRVTIRTGTTVTFYELWKERKPNVKYFHVFGSTCYILADREYHQKWDARSEQGIFLGTLRIAGYRVFNNRSGSVMETINVVINDLDSAIKQMNDEEDETPNMSEIRTPSTVEVSKANNPSDDPGKSLKKSSEEIITKKLKLIPSAHVKKNHPTSFIIGDPSAGMQTRRKEKIGYMKMVVDLCYTSTIEPSTVDSALKDEY